MLRMVEACSTPVTDPHFQAWIMPPASTSYYPLQWLNNLSVRQLMGVDFNREVSNPWGFSMSFFHDVELGGSLYFDTHPFYPILVYM